MVFLPTSQIRFLVLLFTASPTFAVDLDFRPLLELVGEVETIDLGELVEANRLAPLQLLVWDTRSRELPREATEPETLEAVRTWVEGGGRLLLFSHATRWIHDLGFEPVAPDRRDTKLLGHRDAYSEGRYVYGLRASDPGHPLFHGLDHHAEHDDVFLLAGGHAVRNESCFWERSVPEKAEVLGTFFRHGYGEDRGFAHRSLVSLEAGNGRVLAYGCGPLLTEENPRHSNLERFVGNAVRWLCEVPEGAGARPRIGLLPAQRAQLGVDKYSSKPPEPKAAPWPNDVVGPRLPCIAHWGWLGAIDYQRGAKESVDLDYFRERLVDEPAAWGANLLEFYPPDMSSGFPFLWDDNDPIPRPESYWGGGFDPLWDVERTRELIRHAHSRGFLVHSFNHPNPVRREFEEYVAFTERTARDLGNPLLHGSAAALDGFGTEWFPTDREGLITAALWKYNPGAYQHSTAVLPAYTPNFSGTLMCAFGRLGKLNACGFSDQWRNVYHPPLYLSYQADCRTRKPSRREWGGWATFGGGSYPDWLLRQVNGFCRDRLELDSAIWWLGEPESTLHPRYREYVYGITMDPIRCAVACKLWATGRGGYRETIAELSPDPPPGYQAGSDQPFGSAILQNNFLRLVRHEDREGGLLLYDPLHLGRFDPDGNGEPRAIVLFEDFHSSQTPPGEPMDELVLALGAEDGDAEGEASGPFESVYLARGDSFPARIAYEATPDWPERLKLSFTPRVGRHVLRIGILENDGPGLVEVLFDGEPIGFYATGARSGVARPAGEPREFEFSVVDEGSVHELELQVQSGPGHALDFLEVRRVRTGAVAHTIELAAGAKARLMETVVEAGSVPRIRSYSLLADSPVLERGFGFPLEPGALPSLGPASWEQTDGGSIRSAEQAGCWVARRSTMKGTSLGVFEDREAALAFANGSRTGGDGVRRVRTKLLGGADYPLHFVCEKDTEGQAWWTARGAQRLGDQSLLRVHDAPGAPAVVRSDDFLANGFRPGWGCQHALAIEDSRIRGSCLVRVVKTGPFLFAPRVEFDAPVRLALLDGAAWRYFEGNTVYLPNHPGDYEIHVWAEGPTRPTISRTFLTVTECRWLEKLNVLKITAEAPSWYTRPLPGELDYTLLVNTEGRRLVEAIGAEVIPLDRYPLRTGRDHLAMEASGLILRLAAGTATLRFE